MREGKEERREGRRRRRGGTHVPGGGGFLTLFQITKICRQRRDKT